MVITPALMAQCIRFLRDEPVDFYHPIVSSLIPALDSMCLSFNSMTKEDIKEKVLKGFGTWWLDESFTKHFLWLLQMHFKFQKIVDVFSEAGFSRVFPNTMIIESPYNRRPHTIYILAMKGSTTP